MYKKNNQIDLAGKSKERQIVKNNNTYIPRSYNNTCISWRYIFPSS